MVEDPRQFSAGNNQSDIAKPEIESGAAGVEAPEGEECLPKKKLPMPCTGVLLRVMKPRDELYRGWLTVCGCGLIDVGRFTSCVRLVVLCGCCRAAALGLRVYIIISAPSSNVRCDIA